MKKKLHTNKNPRWIFKDGKKTSNPAYLKEWISKNRGKVAEYRERHKEKESLRKQVLKAKTRAKKYNAVGTFTKEEFKKLKIKYKHTCPCCMRKEPVIKLTVDHIIPMSRGGDNFIGNIQPLCISCNDSKSTKTIKYALPS